MLKKNASAAHNGMMALGFNQGASPCARHQILSAQIPQDLGINRSYSGWAEKWDEVFRISPAQFQQILHRDVPGDLRTYVDLEGRGNGEFNISVQQNGRYLFDITNKISMHPQGNVIKFDSWENKGAHGQGLGVALFRNCLEVAALGNIHEIQLRAGKEDGRYFWARHGFYYRDQADQQRVAPGIAQNIEKYAAHMTPAQKQAAADILAQGGLDSCYQLARLEGSVPVGDKTKPLGWALLHTECEANYRLDLHDAAQMARVRASMQRPTVTGPQLKL